MGTFDHVDTQKNNATDTETFCKKNILNEQQYARFSKIGEMDFSFNTGC